MKTGRGYRNTQLKSQIKTKALSFTLNMAHFPKMLDILKTTNDIITIFNPMQDLPKIDLCGKCPNLISNIFKDILFTKT